MKRFACLFVGMMLIFSMFGVQAEENQTGSEEKWWNILFMGGDARSTEQYGLTDCMLIMSVNEEDCEVKMTSIMRDTWVKYPGSGKPNKINAANVFGGPDLSVRMVNEYFGTEIDDYVLVNMSDLAYIIDLAGGIDLYVTESEQNYTNMYAKEFIENIRSYNGDKELKESGNVHLNGLLAVSYTRNRYTDSDFQRVMRQQKVLMALAESFQNMEINDLMEIVGDIQARLETNLETEELKQLAMTAMATDVEAVQQFRIPADGTFESGEIDGTWKIVADFEKNAVLLDEFIYGNED